MSYRQEFLSLETDATGPQIDGLVDPTSSATSLHQHSETDRWVVFPAPLNGWVIVEACEYMIDSFGFVHFRGVVDGNARTADTIFDWPAVPDVSLQPIGTVLLPCAYAQGFSVGTCVMEQTGSELIFHLIALQPTGTATLDIGGVTYYGGTT